MNALMVKYFTFGNKTATQNMRNLTFILYLNWEMLVTQWTTIYLLHIVILVVGN